MIGVAIIALVCAALAFMVWAFVTAPIGWEDSDGFHFGEPDEHASDDNFGI